MTVLYHVWRINLRKYVMSPVEIMSIIEVAKSSAFIRFFLVIFVSFLGAFFGAYIKKKGEVLATKELKKELQTITHHNQLIIEEFKARHSFKMTAIEKRLQVHQEAYTLWRKLLFSLNANNVDQVVEECQTWWNENCLFLSPESRKTFLIAVRCAFHHKDLLNVPLPRNPEDQNLIKSNLDKIMEAGEIIVKSVELPSLGKSERFDVRQSQTPPNK